MPRLLLTRKSGQSVWIGPARMMVTKKRGSHQIRVVISAPETVNVLRGELRDESQPQPQVPPSGDERLLRRLVLHRRSGQDLWIGSARIDFTARGRTVRLAIQAPHSVHILRGELWEMVGDIILPPVAEAACEPPCN